MIGTGLCRQLCDASIREAGAEFASRWNVAVPASSQKRTSGCLTRSSRSDRDTTTKLGSVISRNRADEQKGELTMERKLGKFTRVHLNQLANNGRTE